MLILHIDDDDDDREMLCDALKAIDPLISCIQIESGTLALDFLLTNEILPDYIFIDINMPKMNGYECVQNIKSVPELKKIPIIMFSTTFNPKDRATFTKLGIQYLTKGSLISELTESLKNLIYRHAKELEGE